MDRLYLLEAFLDSHPDPVVITGVDHVVLYMNLAAKEFFKDGSGLEGKSLFSCHNEESKRKMETVLARLAEGEEEIRITDKPGQRTYMRAIRDSAGELIGYYERYTYFPERKA